MNDMEDLGSMIKVTDPLPEEVAADLARLRAMLDQDIPAKALDRNLLIATWNVRAFGDLTEKWRSGDEDTPKRDLHSLLCIAEIVSRFDVIALQEAKDNLKALRRMMHVLGPRWGLSLTDVTKGAPGNGERMAFLFDTRRVLPSGLACELVVPQEQLERIGPDALERQFARTPYAVSFRSDTKTFILVTLHVLFGERAEERAPELRAIAQWLAGWARDVNGWDHNLIALGDQSLRGATWKPDTGNTTSRKFVSRVPSRSRSGTWISSSPRSPDLLPARSASGAAPFPRSSGWARPRVPARCSSATRGPGSPPMFLHDLARCGRPRRRRSAAGATAAPGC